MWDDEFYMKNIIQIRLKSEIMVLKNFYQISFVIIFKKMFKRKMQKSIIYKAKNPQLRFYLYKNFVSYNIT